MCRVRKQSAATRATAMSAPAKSVRLTRETFSNGLAELARRDPQLAAVIDGIGPPPMWARKPGFSLKSSLSG